MYRRAPDKKTEFVLSTQIPKEKTWWLCEPNHTSHGVSQKQAFSWKIHPLILHNPTQASNWPWADRFSLQKNIMFNP